MKIQGQRVLGAEDGRAEEGQERAGVEKPPPRIEPLGFTWAETPSILTTLQPPLVERHATALVAAQAPCDHGGKALGIQASHPRTVRPLLGPRTLTSPRLLCVSRPAAPDHHRPALERPADRRGGPRAARPGDHGGRAGLLRPDRAGAAGRSPRGGDAPGDPHPDPGAGGGPRRRRRAGRGAGGRGGGRSRRRGDPAPPRWPPDGRP